MKSCDLQWPLPILVIYVQRAFQLLNIQYVFTSVPVEGLVFRWSHTSTERPFQNSGATTYYFHTPRSILNFNIDWYAITISEMEENRQIVFIESKNWRDDSKPFLMFMIAVLIRQLTWLAPKRLCIFKCHILLVYMHFCLPICRQSNERQVLHR